MVTLNQQDLLKAGVHLGHLSRKWNPHMAPFIFMESHGIHIIDLKKTLTQLQNATDALQGIARSGKKILFVATKKQAKELVVHTAKTLNMPYMTERWLGGTLTNFITVRKLVKKLTSMDRMMKSATYKNMAKKEQLMLSRDKAKLERDLGGILDLTKLPGALVVVDITKEHIAVQEANRLGIPVIALVDTNANPDLVDYPVPSNDDATPAIQILMHAMEEAIAAGLAMRQEDKTAAGVHDIADDEDSQGFREDSLEEGAEGTGSTEHGEKFTRNSSKDGSAPQAKMDNAMGRTHRPRKRMPETGAKGPGTQSHNRPAPRPSSTFKPRPAPRDFKSNDKPR